MIYTQDIKRIKELGIAAVGDEFFIRSVMLFGLSRSLVIRSELSRDELINALRGFLRELDDIGLLIAQEGLRDVIESLRGAFELPKVLYLPDLRDLSKFDVRQHYINLLRQYLGISVEVS